MASHKKQKSIKRNHNKTTRKPMIPWVMVIAVVAMALLLMTGRHDAAEKSPQKDPTTTSEKADAGARKTPDFQSLVGKWLRPDGGYILEVRSVDRGGQVDGAYFNPRPINIASAEASSAGDTLKLFIEFQDAGYPGSTYDLKYVPGDDTLVGIYFQAVIQQEFDVVFVRR